MIDEVFNIDKFNIYSDEDSYFNLLFTCVMSLREENDKLIEKLKEFSN